MRWSWTTSNGEGSETEMGEPTEGIDQKRETKITGFSEEHSQNEWTKEQKHYNLSLESLEHRCF